MKNNIQTNMRRLMLTTLAVSATWSTTAQARDAGSSQADLIQRVLPGVVTIFVRKTPAAEAQVGSAPTANDTVLDYANGAGFVIDPDGLIMTNRHNVQEPGNSSSASATGRVHSAQW